MKLTKLETDFPHHEVNKIARREVNARAAYRPIYASHKYWARRPGSVFRAILLYLFHPDARGSEGAFWDLYRRDVDLGGKVVLDPFAGGGTLPFEALHLGCSVVGKDLNPLSWFIVRTGLQDVDLGAVDDEFSRIERDLRGSISKYYLTHCPCSPKVDLQALHYFWVKKATCEVCGGVNYLFNNHILAPVSRRGEGWYVVCPECVEVFSTPSTTESTTCPRCGWEFVPSERGPKRGKVFRCRHCEKEGVTSEQNIVETVKKRGTKLESRLYAVEYVCGRCGGRKIKSADDMDLALFEKARRDLEVLEANGGTLVPDQRRRPSFSDRVLNHGYFEFRDMFNARQLLCLGLLLARISSIGDPIVRDHFLLVFSDALAFNNEFCEYNRSNKTLCWIWNKRTVISRSCFVENNVWGTERGTGSFTKAYRKVRRAKEYLKAPFEKYLEEGAVVKGPEHSPVVAKFVDDFSALGGGGNILLAFGDSRDLSEVPRESVDAVVTDPPYLDYVMYADMSDFYHAWLHLALRDIYPQFDAPLIEKAGEIVKDPVTGKGVDFFVGGLVRVFRECAEKLKQDGVLVFTYHHLHDSAWEALGTTLDLAGLRVTAFYPLTGDMKTNLHIQKKGRSSPVDIIIACRPRGQFPPRERVTASELLSRAKASRSRLAKKLGSSDQPVSEVVLGQMLTVQALATYLDHEVIETAHFGVANYLALLRREKEKGKSTQAKV
ncbi:MAG: DUF1156 domain-containing protein [Promethearchaeota archaeon]